jgi:hypothetical protein
MDACFEDFCDVSVVSLFLFSCSPFAFLFYTHGMVCVPQPPSIVLFSLFSFFLLFFDAPNSRLSSSSFESLNDTHFLFFFFLPLFPLSLFQLVYAYIHHQYHYHHLSLSLFLCLFFFSLALCLCLCVYHYPITFFFF